MSIVSDVKPLNSASRHMPPQVSHILFVLFIVICVVYFVIYLFIHLFIYLFSLVFLARWSFGLFAQ